MSRIALFCMLFMLAGAFPLAVKAQSAQAGFSEAEIVANAVVANAEWAADAQICPKLIMASKEATDHFASNECKLGKLAACLKKCSAGTPGACYWLAYALQQQKATPDSSEFLYQRACKLGVMSGCTNRAAGMLVAKKQDEQAKSCAASTFEAVCSFDDPWACTMHAFHLSRGIGVRQDIGRALKALEKSCKYGSSDEACTYAAGIRAEIKTAQDAKK